MKIIPLKNVPLVSPDDDLGRLVMDAAKGQGVNFEDGDVVVVAQSVVSKSEENIIDLRKVEPSNRAKSLAKRIEKDPREAEVILRQTEEVIRSEHVFISRTKHGFICANAGVDGSNVGPNEVTILPDNPDASARSIEEKIRRESGARVAVIISDSQGRPFRLGAIGVAIGTAGLVPLQDLRGEVDAYGKMLTSTQVATADSLAAAATLVMGESDERIPAVVIKGAPFAPGEGSAKDLLRPREEDLFR